MKVRRRSIVEEQEPVKVRRNGIKAKCTNGEIVEVIHGLSEGPRIVEGLGYMWRNSALSI